MKPIPTAALLVLSTTLFAPAASAQSDDCKLIESLPTTIASPGNYCMVANATLNMTSGAAITIAANNVTVDCRDFTVFNEAASAAGSSAGVVAVSKYNLLVRNCRLVGGFTDGIRLTMPLQDFNTSFYNRVEDNYVAGPYRHGILAYGSAVEVLRNRVYDVGGQTSGVVAGIRIGGGTLSSNKFQVVDGNLVAGTSSTTNHAYAILSDGSVGALFRDNTLTGTAGGEPSFRGTGIRVTTGTAISVRDNHIVGRGQSNEIGIQLPTNGGVCFDNRILVSLTNTIGCDTTYGNY